MSLEIWSFVVDVLSLIATVVLTVAIYWLQRSHEKEREQMEVEAQKKAVAEAARVFLIDNEDEIECLPLSAIAKSLNLKRKHHRAITTKFLRCSEEVQKEMKRKRMAFWTRKTRKIPPTSTRAAGISWTQPFRITTRCSTRTTRPMANGSRTTTKMYRSA